jgi:hypothetical protein
MKIELKKTFTAEPGVQLESTKPVVETAVAARAYQLWQERG